MSYYFKKDECYDWRTEQTYKLDDETLIERLKLNQQSHEKVKTHLKEYSSPYLHTFWLITLAHMTQLEKEIERRGIKTWYKSQNDTNNLSI